MVQNSPKKISTERVRYKTIRLREEVANQLDEWKELFDDSSMSEVMWRVFALARRELKRVKDKKRKAKEQFIKNRQKLAQENGTNGDSVVK